jgi:preprotein translocase subunit SecG
MESRMTQSLWLILLLAACLMLLVLLQQILEGAGLPFTGMTSDFAFKCSNRLTLSKVRTTTASSLANGLN